MVSIAIYCSKLLKKIVLNVSDCSSTPNPWGHQKRIHHQSRTRRHPIWPQQSSLAIRSGQLGQQATTTRSVISPRNLVQLATPPRSWTVNENFAPRGLQIYQLSTTRSPRCVHKQQIAISEDFGQNLAGHPQLCARNPLVGRSRSTRCGNRWAERTLARCLTRWRAKICGHNQLHYEPPSRPWIESLDEWTNLAIKWFPRRSTRVAFQQLRSYFSVSFFLRQVLIEWTAEALDYQRHSWFNFANHFTQKRAPQRRPTRLPQRKWRVSKTIFKLLIVW